MGSVPLWLTQHFCPALGIILNILMWSATYPKLKDAMKKEDLGSINTTPFLMMIFSCLGWFTYGVQHQEYYVACSSIYGMGAGLAYISMSLMILAVNKKYEEADKIIHFLVFTAFFWCGIAVVIGITLVGSGQLRTIGHYLVGIVCDICSISYYAAPLTTLVTIVRKHDSSSLHLPTIVLNSINCVLWLSYGLIAVGDIMLWIPSAVGLSLGILEILVFFGFQAKKVVIAISTKISTKYSEYSAKRRSRKNSSGVVESSKSSRENAIAYLNVHDYEKDTEMGILGSPAQPPPESPMATRPSEEVLFREESVENKWVKHSTSTTHLEEVDVNKA